MRCQCDRDAFDCDNDAVSGGLCETCARVCHPPRVSPADEVVELLREQREENEHD